MAHLYSRCTEEDASPSGCLKKRTPTTTSRVGPVIPAAERALDVGSADELTGVLCEIVRGQVEERHGRAIALKEHAAEGVAAAREYVEASLGLQVWAHRLYKQAIAVAHAPSRRS